MEPRFFNRELSWLEFNARVLHQALRKELPLLERLQFLSIITSNFDEFFQVRVAAVKRAQFAAPHEADVSGLTPDIVLQQISVRAHQIIRQQQDCLMNDVLPALAERNIVYVTPADFTAPQNDFVQNFFRTEVYPLLTPRRTDTAEFPLIGNLALHAAFLLKPIFRANSANVDFKGSDDVPRISFVKIPDGVPKVIWLPSERGRKCFTLLDDVILQCGTQLFPGLGVEEAMLFKVARDADFAVDEDSGRNFIHEMEKVLVRRNSSFAVQLSCNNTSETILKFFMEKLELAEEDVYRIDGILDPSALMALRDTEESARLSFPAWQHFYPPELPQEEPFWNTLKQRDILLHVPYESYEPVVKFISDAADDPDVLAIKMTLYRTGRDSPIVKALERAARNGKQVAVLVELKARFDEERNIAWANELENAGVTVIYGLVNLKVHAKILMVMRREDGTIRRYAHIATGNYNPRTAKVYSDLSLFTANYEIVNDATQFFNVVTGYSTLQAMKHLGMAPVTLKPKLLAMIQREIERSAPERPGLIIAKMNSLTHEEIIRALYEASRAGVRILLNVRGICMLVPGVPGMSENIRVVSIVDRYLEHSRIFYFQNGGSQELYLSSADWMPRNLDRRIELLFPVLDRKAFHDVKSILDTYFRDNTNAHQLKENGVWEPVARGAEEPSFRAQESLYKKYRRRSEAAVKFPKIQFEVRRKD
ncbi:MAG: polyphosphate kinase 1 [Treponemataceae bacterium]|nr:polyphosphate kinase 1 [Treponemataceae bacterium]